MIPFPGKPSCFETRPPDEAEQELFLHSYLRGFEANPERFPAAIQNMGHLFNRRGLRFLMAFHAGRPAGIGMLYCVGKVAVLCAGATLPEHRRQGCHAALLRARLRLAVEQGCERIFSWTMAGSQSHTNMERAGLRTVGITSAWRLLPNRERRPR
jgi:GNAT superfamily N-acetyltransferase